MLQSFQAVLTDPISVTYKTQTASEEWQLHLTLLCCFLLPLVNACETKDEFKIAETVKHNNFFFFFFKKTCKSLWKA